MIEQTHSQACSSGVSILGRLTETKKPEVVLEPNESNGTCRSKGLFAGCGFAQKPVKRFLFVWESGLEVRCSMKCGLQNPVTRHNTHTDAAERGQRFVIPVCGVIRGLDSVTRKRGTCAWEPRHQSAL